MKFQEREIVETALKNLEYHTGIQGYWHAEGIAPRERIDGEITLNISGSHVTFFTEVKREFREYHMEKLLHQAKLYRPLLLVADRIFPAQKEKLRQHGISYLDTSGNGYIKEGTVLLWLDGQKAIYQGMESPKTNRAFTKAGLKVVYALLQNQNAVNYSYREIAMLAGVALGTIKEAMEALKSNGYLLRVNKERMLIDNKKQLFENWLSAYGNVLKPSQHIGNFHFRDAPGWKNITLPPETLWGAEPAGELLTLHLQPQQWTIYTAKSKNEVARALLLAPGESGNLKMYKKFWMDVVIDARDLATPPLITYADLMLTGEPRCIETANIIYEQYLKRIFEN